MPPIPPNCGALTTTGNLCRHPAGFGTDHYGIGRCRAHGGIDPRKKGKGYARETRRTAPLSKAKLKEIEKNNNSLKRPPRDPDGSPQLTQMPRDLNEAKVFMGLPIEMSPVDAIQWIIRVTAGEIKWLSDEIEKLTTETGIENTIQGKQFHLYVRQRTLKMDLLAKYSKWALDNNIAERTVRLAEAYGEQMYRLMSGVLDDLELTRAQRVRAPEIILKHMMLLEKRNLRNDPNPFVAGVEPDTIVIENSDVKELTA